MLVPSGIALVGFLRLPLRIQKNRQEVCGKTKKLRRTDKIPTQMADFGEIGDPLEVR